MFCGKCGTKIDAGETVCPNCGSALARKAAPAKKAAVDPKLLAVAVVAIVAVAAFVLLSGGRSEEQVIKEFFDTMVAGDVEGFLETMPDEILDSTYEGSDMTYRKVCLQIPGGIKASNISIVPDILSIQKVSNSSEYKRYGIKVSEVKDANVELMFMTEDVSDSNTYTVRLVKVGQKWYVDPCRSSFFG